MNCSHLDQYINTGSKGEFLFDILRKEGKVNAYTLAEWCIVETRGVKFEHFISQKFNRVGLVEHYLSFYKYRIEKEERKTIGFMFGLIEDAREEFFISEYSLSQTSLEQIFNFFAQQGENKTMAITAQPGEALEELKSKDDEQ